VSEEAFDAVHELRMRLSYADCDPAGIVYFAAWLPWMERVQSEWMYLRGLRADQLEQRFGFRVVSRAVECEYLVPAGLFDVVTIALGIVRIGRTSVRWGCRMVRDDGALVARAALTIVTTDADGRPIPLPDPLAAACCEAVARTRDAVY